MKKLSHEAIKNLLPEKFRLMADASTAIDDLIYTLNETIGKNDVLIFSGEPGTGKKLIADTIFSFHASTDYFQYYCNDASFDNFLHAAVNTYRKTIDNSNLFPTNFLLIEGIARLKQQNQYRLYLYIRKYLTLKNRKSLLRGIILTEDNHPSSISSKFHFKYLVKDETQIKCIHFPSLKQMRNEFGIILSSYILYFNKKLYRRISSIDNYLLVAMSLYHWPGNLNELESLVHRGFILDQEDTLYLSDWTSEMFSMAKLNNEELRLVSPGLTQIQELRKKHKTVIQDLSKPIIALAKNPANSGQQ